MVKTFLYVFESKLFHVQVTETTQIPLSKKEIYVYVTEQLRSYWLQAWLDRSPSCSVENEQQMLEEKQVWGEYPEFRVPCVKLKSPVTHQVAVQVTESQMSSLSICGL